MGGRKSSASARAVGGSSDCEFSTEEVRIDVTDGLAGVVRIEVVGS